MCWARNIAICSITVVIRGHKTRERSCLQIESAVFRYAQCTAHLFFASGPLCSIQVWCTLSIRALQPEDGRSSNALKGINLCILQVIKGSSFRRKK